MSLQKMMTDLETERTHNGALGANLAESLRDIKERYGAELDALKLRFAEEIDALVAATAIEIAARDAALARMVSGDA